MARTYIQPPSRGRRPPRATAPEGAPTVERAPKPPSERRPEAALALLGRPGGSAQLALLKAEDRRRSYAQAARAPRTRAAYEGDWRRFCEWAGSLGLPTLPTSPTVVGQYLAYLADEGCAPATIDRVVAALRFFHKEGGFDWYSGHPDIAEARAGIRRKLGTAQSKKAPLTDELLLRALGLVEGVMERAILVVGFFAGLRRSEIAGLAPDHVTFTHVKGKDWLVVRLPRRKTDQQGKGTEIAACERDDAACPVRAMRAWLAARPAGDRLFPVCDRTIARLVQRTAKALGLDPDAFGGHSLRAGLATSADAAGVPMATWMRQTGHKSERVARGYVRHTTLFEANVTEALARKDKL